jgi:hypothetical protein
VSFVHWFISSLVSAFGGFLHKHSQMAFTILKIL